MSEIDFSDQSMGDAIWEVFGKIILRKDIQKNSLIHNECKNQKLNKRFEKNSKRKD